MKTLPALNSTDWFCKLCGIGPAENCPGVHVEDWRRPGSSTRHYAALVLAIIFFAVLWLAGMSFD